MKKIRKILCLILCISVIAVWNNGGVFKADASRQMPADVNGDGKSDSSDMLALQQHLLGISSIDDIYSGDVNDDLSVNSSDMLALQQHLLGIKLLTAKTSEYWTAVTLTSAEQRANGIAGGEGGQWELCITYAPGDGNLAFMGTDVGGMFKSTDSGKSWTPSSVGFNAGGTTGITVDPNNSDRVLAVGVNSCASKYNGLYLSSDGGESWRGVCNVRIVGHRDFRRQIAYDPSSYDSNIGGSAVVYWSREAKTYDKGEEVYPAIYKSTDGGETWSVINDSSDVAGAQIECNPENGWLYAANSNGFFRSKDGGVSFEQILTSSVLSLDVVASRPDSVYITQNDGLYISTDGGTKFKKVSRTGYPTVNPCFLNVSPANPDYMVLQNDLLSYEKTYSINTVYYSHDGGITWQLSVQDISGTFIPFNPRQNPFAWHPTDPNVCLKTGGDYIMRSDDGGATFGWSNSGNNGSCTTYLGINVNNPKLMAVSNQDYSGAYTTDSGKTWKYLGWYKSWGGMTYGAYPVDENTVITILKDGANVYGHGKNAMLIAYTADGGDTIKVTDCVVTGGKSVIGVVGNDNIVMAGEWRSTDRGRTWSKMDGCTQIFTYNIAGGTLYGTDGTGIVSSSDAGATWTVLGSYSGGIADMAYNNEQETLWFIAKNNRTLYRFDLNSSFLSVVGTLPVGDGAESTSRYRSIAIDPVDGNIIYIGQAKDTYKTPAGVLRSQDGGLTWKTLTRSPGDGSVGADGGNECSFMRVNPLTRELYTSGGCRGLWKYTAPIN